MEELIKKSNQLKSPKKEQNAKPRFVKLPSKFDQNLERIDVKVSPHRCAHVHNGGLSD